MPVFGPIKRSNLIHYLHDSGFEGPYSGKKHQFMLKGEVRLTIPNPHKSDISKNLLSRLLKQAEISKEEWEKL